MIELILIISTCILSFFVIKVSLSNLSNRDSLEAPTLLHRYLHRIFHKHIKKEDQANEDSNIPIGDCHSGCGRPLPFRSGKGYTCLNCGSSIQTDSDGQISHKELMKRISQFSKGINK